MILNDLKKEAEESNIPIVKVETLNKILKIIKENNIINILEIGSAIGYSSIAFALINKNIKIITIEKDKERYNKAKENINKFNLNNQIKIINADANKILETEEFKNKYRNYIKSEYFDMVFLDAAKGQYINFLNKTIDYIKNEGYIIADNVLFKGYVLGEYKLKKHRTIVNNLREFINILQNKENFKTDLYKIDDGLLISKKLKNKDKNKS